MLELYIGFFLLIVGTLGSIIGPNVEDPLVRFLNIEVTSCGVSLVFLAYDETLALMTYLAVNALLTIIIVRAILIRTMREDNEDREDMESIV
ncbi:EhaE family protein [Methanocaldococcus infernus]